MNSRLRAQELLAPAGITLDGNNPWDPQIRDESVFGRLFSGGYLAIGETYMEGLWDVKDLPELIRRVHRSDVSSRIRAFGSLKLLPHIVRHRFLNLQSKRRAFEVGEKHYDIGNDLYERMLDKRLVYTCAYWRGIPPAGGLNDAQEAKLDLVCRKIGLKRGDRVFDAGCGFGSFAIFAAERYGAHVVGVTVSKEQAALARERAKGLPVEIRVQDYRDVYDGPFDHVVSIGLMEHIGPRNYHTFMNKVSSLLKDDGLFLAHTIGSNWTWPHVDPWFDKYIFPNGYLPSPELMGKAISGTFVLEDWHNIGPDYDKTLMAWWENFQQAWPELEAKYGKRYGGRFYRMWKYYLLSSAGSFRSRHVNLWQLVLSKKGIPGGYTAVR